MARLRDRAESGWRYDPESHEAAEVQLNLLLGPTGEYTEDQLRIAWEVERDFFIENDKGHPGNRSWAYWRFELGEEPPRDSTLQFPWPEAIRLAELSDLRPDEVAALAERAAVAKARIARGPEHERRSYSPQTDTERWTDREKVEAWEKVEKALKR